MSPWWGPRFEILTARALSGSAPAPLIQRMGWADHSGGGLRRFRPPVEGQSPHPARQPAAQRGPYGIAHRAPALIAWGARGSAELAPAAATGVRDLPALLVVSGLHQISTAPTKNRLNRRSPRRR